MSSSVPGLCVACTDSKEQISFIHASNYGRGKGQ